MRRVPRARAAPPHLGDLVRAFLAGALGMTLLVAAALALYILKSRLGIDLIPGPSPLHDLFVALRKAGLV